MATRGVRRPRWAGSSIISHELLAAARTPAIQRVISDMAPIEVRVIVTVRDLPRQLVAVWQEDIKNGSTETFSDFLSRVRSDAVAPDRLRRRFWRLQDSPGILANWASELGPESVTVVTVPHAGDDPALLWQRFAAACGIDPAGIDADVPRLNSSLGAAESELIRRLNDSAMRDLEWPDYRRLVKKRLAESDLAARSESPRLTLPPSMASWALELEQPNGGSDSRSRVCGRRYSRRPDPALRCSPGPRMATE